MADKPKTTIAEALPPYKMSSEMHIDFCNALAQDFKRTARYVAFSPDNLKTYSIEYVRLLLDTCSEIEALAKLYCERLFAQRATPDQLPKKNPNIKDWRHIIVTAMPTFPSIGVQVFNQARFYPWKEWGDKEPSNPPFWNAYNKVKHDRTKRVRLANFENVLMAMCGLTVFSSRLYTLHYHGIEQPWFKL